MRGGGEGGPGGCLQGIWGWGGGQIFFFVAEVPAKTLLFFQDWVSMSFFRRDGPYFFKENVP